MGSANNSSQSGPPPKDQSPSSPLLPRPAGEVSWLGLPRFQWSLALIGLCVFTFSVVTVRLPGAEAGVAIAVVGLILQRDKVRVPFPIWLYGAFVLWASVGSYVSPYSTDPLTQVLERLKLLVIMLIVVNALRTEGQIRFYLLFFLACFVLSPVRGTLMGGDTIFGRARWNQIYSNPNDLAALCVLALGMALGLTYSEQPRILVRLGGAISAFLLLVVILLTQSRGAFIGLVAGFGPAMIWSALKRPGRMLVSTAVLALVIGYTIPADVWERLAGIEKMTSTSTIAEADPEGSAEQRFGIQQAAWKIFLDNPVLGVGLGNYPLVNGLYAPQLGPRDTHNTYLNLAAEVGLPGLMIWCALVWSVLRYAYRSRRQAVPGALATQQSWVERALWGFLVAGMFGTYGARTFPYLILAVLWCSATLLVAPLPASGNGARAAGR